MKRAESLEEMLSFVFLSAPMILPNRPIENTSTRIKTNFYNKIALRIRSRSALSGCARGEFAAMPWRALLISASAPPPCSRKSRSLCSLRFSVRILDLVFYYNILIVNCASKTTLLPERTQFVAYLRHLPFPVNGNPRQSSGLRPRTAGEVARFYNMCALKYRATRAEPSKS